MQISMMKAKTRYLLRNFKRTGCKQNASALLEGDLIKSAFNFCSTKKRVEEFLNKLKLSTVPLFSIESNACQ
jgi:hypothetical protein